MAKYSKEVTKTQELFNKIVDTDVYSINDINGKEQKMTGVELKAYMVSMRGQIDFTELVDEIEKSSKKPTTATVKVEKKEEIKKTEASN
jgi:hypothetical protein